MVGRGVGGGRGFVVGSGGFGRRRLVSRSGLRASTPRPIKVKFTDRNGSKSLKETLSHIDTTAAAGRAQIDYGGHLTLPIVMDCDLFMASRAASEVASVHGNSCVGRLISTAAGNLTRGYVVISSRDAAFTLFEVALFRERTGDVSVDAFVVRGSTDAIGRGQSGRCAGEEECSGQKSRQLELHLSSFEVGF